MTTKQQRRNNGVQNVVAAQKRSNSKPAMPTAPVVPATEQSEAVVVNLDASPVNAPAAPAEPAVPAEAEQTPAVEPVAAAEQEATPVSDTEPVTEPTPATYTNRQEVEMIIMGLQNLLGIKGDFDLTPEGLMTVGLRTVRQTLMAILADGEAVEAIRAKKEELVSKAKVLIAEATETAAAPAAEPAPPPAAEVRQEPRVIATGSLARWLPTGQMANRVHLHADDKEVGVEGEYANYRWYKVDGKLVWDYK